MQVPLECFLSAKNGIEMVRNRDCRMPYVSTLAWGPGWPAGLAFYGERKRVAHECYSLHRRESKCSCPYMLVSPC